MAVQTEVEELREVTSRPTQMESWKVVKRKEKKAPRMKTPVKDEGEG